MSGVDKSRLQAAFSRSAAGYESHAHVQRHVLARVRALADAHAPDARRILDVGAGTGALLADLGRLRKGLVSAGVDLAHGMMQVARARVPGAALATADAEALPFSSGAFELVLSTSTLQWLVRLDRAFAEAHRGLAPGGVFCLALFCGETLHELRSSWRAALARSEDAPADRTHRFFAPEEIEAALTRVGFRVAACSSEKRIEVHPDPAAVIRSVKRIGASSAAPTQGAGLAGRRTTLEAIRLYQERYGAPGGVPATYDVFYSVALKRG